MSALGASSFNERHAPKNPEYSLYANVSDRREYNGYVQPLTDEHLIQRSDCDYQRIWNDIVQPHFKAGLLLCRDGVNIERALMNRVDNIRHRAIFLILCEAGVRHYEGRGPTWVEREEDMTPGNYIYLSWNFDHLFTTADGKLIQLKVVDAHPEPAQTRPAFGNGKRQVAMLLTRLNQNIGYGNGVVGPAAAEAHMAESQRR